MNEDNRPDTRSTAKSHPLLPKGTLVLVGTPIGNLGDLSSRAMDALAQADLIAAEDTRRTRQLLTHLGLHQPLTSYHEHNQVEKGRGLLDKLRNGEVIVLVSDAGMPCISDPGAMLVAQCVEADIPVLVIPGPSAAITALAGSGLDSDRFTFEGFLPTDRKLQKVRLAELQREVRTMILYEAPHRLKKTLQILAKAGMVDRRLSLGRELTKLHEEFVRGSVQSLLDFYGQQDPRGEYVLVLEGLIAYNRRTADYGGSDQLSIEAQEAQDVQLKAQQLIRQLLESGQPVQLAVREAMQQTGLKKNDLYALALALKAEI